MRYLHDEREEKKNLKKLWNYIQLQITIWPVQSPGFNRIVKLLDELIGRARKT